MKHFTVLTILSLIGSFQASAQFSFEYDNSIEVIKNAQAIQMPWSGGLNTPQFSDFDFDYDGDLDLFVFDRTNDDVHVFVNDLGNYFYEFNARIHFPVDLRYRATFIDYDNDGKKDLFTHHLNGIKVYRNVGDAVSGLQWQLVSEALQSNYWGFVNTLYVNSSDIPAIVDVDFDGDYDVLSFHVGGEYLQYHKNLSMELYGISDSLVFELKNECWGKFREDLNNSFIYLNVADAPCGSGNIPGAEIVIGNDIKPVSVEKSLHAGSTVLALDVDNSGVLDLVIGDVSTSNLKLLINGGSAPNTNSEIIQIENDFPSNSLPAAVSIFPASYFLDVDFDGLKDLIVCPNAVGISENRQGVLFYKNTGTNNSPSFQYQQNDFLQGEMIDLGSGAIPVFFDYDQDGLMDLFVSNFQRFEALGNYRSGIAYFKNMGSTSNPEFTFIDNNFLDLEASFGARKIPTFGDLDNDGDMDMLIGIENGSLVFFENTSVAPNCTFNAPISNFTDNLGNPIIVNQFAAPQLIDLNTDGLLDLIIGSKTGELAFYANIGTLTAPSFQLQNTLLGGIDLSEDGSDVYSIPHFFENDDTLYLLIGSLDGAFRLYDNIESNLSTGETFHERNMEYLNLRFGGHSAFAVYDINGDENLNLFAGNELGGLFHFEHNPFSTLNVGAIDDFSVSFQLYPVPTTESLTIASTQQVELECSISDLSGNLVIEPHTFTTKLTIDCSKLKSGVYFVSISDRSGNKCLKRFIKF